MKNEETRRDEYKQQKSNKSDIKNLVGWRRLKEFAGGGWNDSLAMRWIFVLLFLTQSELIWRELSSIIQTFKFFPVLYRKKIKNGKEVIVGCDVRTGQRENFFFHLILFRKVKQT